MRILAATLTVLAVTVMVANLIMDGYEARTGESWEEKVKQSKTKKQ